MADASPNQGAGAQPQADGSGSYNPAVGYLNAEARRTVTSPIYGTSPSSTSLPRDTVLKRMLLKVSLSTQVTFASGAPTTSELGVFERVCTNIEMNINGNRIIKSVRPHLARMHNMMLAGESPRRSYTSLAGAPTTIRAGREWLAGTIAYQATTGYMIFQECLELNFENPWGYGGSRQMSELDLRDVASADLRFTWAPITNLQRDGVGAPVAYTNTSVLVTPQLIENRARPRPVAGQTLFDYVETTFARTYTGQARSQQIDLQTGNFLMGLGIFCRNGDVNQTPQENLLTNMALYLNGATAIQGPFSHADLQDENCLRFGVNDYLGFNDQSGTIDSQQDTHALRGFAMMNLVRNGDWNTSINTSRQAGVDSVKIQFDTPSSTGIDPGTYTNPMEVSIHTHEIRPYTYTR